MEETGQINASTYPLPAACCLPSIESASNPANSEQAADDPASANPQQPAGYPANNPSANPQQPAGYPANNPSANPQQPAGYPANNPSANPQQPAGYPANNPSANPQQPAGYPANNSSANPQQPAGYPANNPSANPQQPAGYPANNPSAYPQQPAGYPTYSSAYPQQPNVSSAYLLQPMGAQTVTVDQPKHSVSFDPPQPPTYLPLTIFNIICCCFVLALFAKRYGAQVVYEYERHNYEEAKRASRKALYFNIGALLSGIAIWAVVIGSFVFYFAI